MSELLIRTYCPEDLHNVVQLWNARGLLVPHNNPFLDIDRKLSESPDWFLIGEVDSQVVASCMFGYDGHRGWINYLAVHPGQQRNGYGRLIVESAIVSLLKVGCPKVNLQIRRTNSAVQAFYGALGFTEDNVMSLGKRLIPDEPYDV